MLVAVDGDDGDDDAVLSSGNHRVKQQRGSVLLQGRVRCSMLREENATTRPREGAKLTGRNGSGKHTKCPPAFHSDDVHRCSLTNARKTSEKLARIIDKASATQNDLGRSVVKVLGFSRFE